jgi:AcrR family transcriptional regulator
MGRKSTFEDDRVFAAVGAEMAATGRFTLEGLNRATGLSTGSVYHRFASREALLAETWLHAVRAFQTGFLKALRLETADAADEAALATPRFCRANRDAAVVLACCRRAQFLGAETPDALRRAVAGLNDEAAAELQRFSRRIDRPLLACRLALVAYPLAAVRLFLPERPVPKSIDAEILKASRAALA